MSIDSDKQEGLAATYSTAPILMGNISVATYCSTNSEKEQCWPPTVVLLIAWSRSVGPGWISDLAKSAF